MRAEATSVLIVEDEYLIALDLQDWLEMAGYRVLGPYANVGDTLDAMAEQMPDAAILDVKLSGEDVLLVAEQLKQHGVPILFHSGHARNSQLEARFPGAYFCGKPSTAEALIGMLQKAVAV